MINGTADSAQLTVLKRAFSDYCRERAIEPQSEDGEDAARLLMSLWSSGARTPDEIRAALAMTETVRRRA